MKIALGVEYLGTNFHGWQIQKGNIRTVQKVVEKALSKIANHPVRVFCSGRTDSGVHGVEQVIHFETDAIRNEKAWVFGGNVNLPSDVNFIWAKQMDDNFHARFSAIAREYQYKIYNTKVRSALNASHFLWEPRKLNINAMNQSANILLGKHDFSAFRGSLCQAKSPIKTIEKIQFTKNNNELILSIKANAFLHHMVRNIVGTLLKVGKEERSVKWVEDVLDSKQRKNAGPTAPPQGLYFVKAFY